MATCSGFDDATRCFEVLQVEKVDAWTERIDETQELQAFQASASDFFLEADEFLSHPHRFSVVINDLSLNAPSL